MKMGMKEGNSKMTKGGKVAAKTSKKPMAKKAMGSKMGKKSY